MSTTTLAQSSSESAPAVPPDSPRPAAPAARAPGATIDVRREPPSGVVVTVLGVVGRNDAAILSSRLHTELDAAPDFVVVDLSQVLCVALVCRNVLATVHERARALGVALAVVDPGDCMGGDRIITEHAGHVISSPTTSA